MPASPSGPPSPYAIGATLYLPVTRERALDVVLGRKLPGLRSVVLCLEDALAEGDVAAGLDSLRRVMTALEHHDGGPRPLVFVRPRSVDMAGRIAAWRVVSGIAGFVAPKFRGGEMQGWFDAVAGTHLLLMPTLETAELFDPGAVRDFRDELLTFDRARVLALRIGGNDLLACLGLRRMRGMTTYEGPLASVCASLVGMLVPAGFHLTAPVFEILDDAATLERELQHDMAFGFVGKTAIHPVQVPLIHAALAVDPTDLETARQILGSNAPAVFSFNGAMCEPRTHVAWAHRILERAEHCGLQPCPTARAHAKPSGTLAA
ncbi:MAG: HpcH/HpaI aldolase/citrate lyase family protein [Gemmatimonadaceae bacterium]|nr:HpcH/HpaI aldolase/citrate lyase family protein [Acetobacteraceae bacterium]